MYYILFYVAFIVLFILQFKIRDEAGNYIAIGSRGNLFLTWAPGQDYWVPHNRGSSRRIQNMG
jgi:photosystem II stability/assembly factor-like uncharacterized protein